ncbi:MAG: methyl-accepting chemotaxis protein [Chitinophagales bacterium]
MNAFTNLTLRVKIMAIVCIMAVGMIGLSLYGVQTAANVATGSRQLYDINLMGTRYASNVEAMYAFTALAVYQHIAAQNETDKKEFEKTINQRLADLKKAIKDCGNAVVTDREKALLANIVKGVDEYEKQLPELLRLSYANQSEKALDIARGRLEQIRDQMVIPSVDELMKLNIDEATMKKATNDKLARSARTNAVVALVLVLAVAVLLSNWIANIIANPVKKVQAVAKALAGGDLSQTIGATSTDEVGRMAASIDEAIENLRTMIGQISQTAEQVAASSEELASSAQTVGQTTQQVAETINQLAKGSDEQAKQAQETSSVVEGMSASIQQVTASAQTMGANSNHVVKNAEDGEIEVNKAIQHMNSIKTIVEQAAGVVQSLGERSQEIGRIVDVITGIADQTNLLALNAAIEAARAGEQGRGFAVVAEEVRKLAEQSGTAAQQISNLIQEIRTETDRAVESMKLGTKAVAEGTEVVNGTGQTFLGIVKDVKELVAQIQEVSAAMVQLGSGAEKATKAVESIAAITEEAAAGAEEISASSEEQTASVEEIAASSESLAEMAQELQKAVATFKL